ncbi:MAG: SDR family NAD(P)-dependent oxidoreductase [Lentimicrobiaceae bacterium]|nr:SDR family NAD(P)-dependent oxidoreductase [Lentimicrobiaceae bacterium]
MIDNSFCIKGKTILITGASSGIGKQVAIDLSKMGAKVVIVGRDKTRTEETYNLLENSEHKFYCLDLTDGEKQDELVEQLPQLDGIVHSAAITHHLPAKFVSHNDIDNVFSINFNAIVELNSKLLRKKRIAKPASIVHFTSLASKYPYYGGSIYAASKAALEVYSRCLAIELADRQIRVNCVQPSFVKTPMVETATNNIGYDVVESSKRLMPLEIVDIEDVSKTVSFLISDASKWISGAIIPLGGG